MKGIRISRYLSRSRFFFFFPTPSSHRKKRFPPQNVCHTFKKLYTGLGILWHALPHLVLTLFAPPFVIRRETLVLSMGNILFQEQSTACYNKLQLVTCMEVVGGKIWPLQTNPASLAAPLHALLHIMKMSVRALGISLGRGPSIDLLYPIPVGH